MSKIFKAFEAQEKSIRRIIRKYRSNPADIDELVQDVFLTCYSIELTETIKQPEHLLFRVARNLAINEARKKINTTSTSLPIFEDSPVYIDEKQISVEDQLNARQKLLIFADALASVPENERRVFVLRRMEGLKFSQIATRLNISVSTAERRAAAAVMHCYKYFKANGHDPADFGASIPKRMKPKKTLDSATKNKPCK